MASSEYWMIKRGDEYLGVFGFAPEKLQACRYSRKAIAIHDMRRAGGRLVHVRIRPKSERLYLTDRLAHWQPIIFAAREMARAHDELRQADEQDISIELIHLAKRLPKEHRP